MMSATKLTEKSVHPLYVVDAFARTTFKGNSAAVCLISFGEEVSKDVKQKIAAEMNLSETAFITRKSQGDTFKDGSLFKLEWFTPTCEVTLCGHATLASAAVLFMGFNNPSKYLEFETISGILKAKQLANNKIEIDLPAYKFLPVKESYGAIVRIIAGSLSVENVVLSHSRKLLIQLSDKTTRKELEAIHTNEHELLSAASDIKGVIVTLKGSGKDDCKDEDGKDYDFISRYFAPWLGILEDPVTGSAHSVLAPYWSEILKKNSFYARQCSSRGGDLEIQLHEDRVHISGSAIIVIQGNINF